MENKDIEFVPLELTGYCQVVGCMVQIPSNADNPYCKDHQGEGLKTPALLTKWDFEQALNSQSACNATGLIHSLNEIREKLWETARHLGHGTKWVNHHPILQLYAYQLAHLCHGREPIEWEGWKLAYEFCCSVRDGNTSPDFNYQIFLEEKQGLYS